MSTKLQQYKSAKAKLRKAGHKMHWSFHDWLLPAKYRSHYVNAKYAHDLINAIEIPANVAISEALSI